MIAHERRHRVVTGGLPDLILHVNLLVIAVTEEAIHIG